MERTGRITERIFLGVIALILGFLFNELYGVLQRDFDEVPQRIGNGTMVNLNHENPGSAVKTLLERGFYFEDPRDVTLAAEAVNRGMAAEEATIDNIGELNKSKYNIPAEEAYAKGGESYRKRAKAARLQAGFTGRDTLRYAQEKSAPPPMPAYNEIGLGSRDIHVSIQNKSGAPVGGVLVRLQLVVPMDSTYSALVSEVESQRIERGPTQERTYAADTAGNKQLIALTAYARTGNDGKAGFRNLPEDRTYEVLPLQPGFQFGASKGVQSLSKDRTFSFTQQLHTIRLFSTRDYNNLRKEGSLIVRTPEEASRWFIIIVAAFFAGFFLLHLFLSLRFRTSDPFILPLVMLLMGFSLLTLISLQDPLRDRFLARSTLWYFIGGFIGMMFIMLFDLKRFTTDSGLYRLFAFNGKGGAKGIQWALLALVLLVLTVLLGSGPEGSGVKVNLFGFQPSEWVKFIIVIFLAGFFAANERFISEYATMQKRWSFFSFALGAILLTILLFLMLGDLGPAIVVCFTFIILFSFSRGDFAYMTGAVVLFVLSNWVIGNIWIATGVTALLMVLTMLFIRKQLSESAIMALVVMAGFMLIDQVPLLDRVFPGPVQRLADRKSIWLDKWDNEVFGGDQIANGIWAMSSGGVAGQGIGEGFAKTIPEAHTDMILPAIGEEFGWAGIICVFILFLLYLHRSIIIGRQTGRSFLFYICAGIGIATFVQFLLIAGGSIGALPLSGVSLPFISYGGSSLIANMLATGFLISVSLVRGSAVQMNYITRQDRNLVPALVAACVGLVLLGVNVGRYLFNNSEWVVQPALVAERSGARMFSYNPRIDILMNRLQAGALYDRRGRLLATSKPETLTAQRDTLAKAGIAPASLLTLSHRRQDRYYPFGAHMFFWTGDANTGIFKGGTNGYFGEYQHDAALRGFETPLLSYTVAASRFREQRFLPGRATEMTVTRKDYSALAPLLIAGINSPEVEAFKQRNRDVQLSMDAGLQTAIQQGFALDDSLRDNRVSVVIMEDATGDVLASAGWPLPLVADWDLMTMPAAEQNKLPFWTAHSDLGFTHATQPGSTAKVVTTLAAFNKLGLDAAKKNILIRQQDLIRIKSLEPDEPGNISLERALVRSNNSYFIKLANEEQLQEEMAQLYMQTGMFLRGVGGYYYQRDPNNEEREAEWLRYWRDTEFRSLRSYNRNDIRKTRGRGVSGMAWGQGELMATPAAVARLAAGVANNGVLMPHRYVLRIADSAMGTGTGISLVRDSQYTKLVTGYMKKQSENKKKDLGISVAGKTGTPERIWRGERINDGWYVFFAPKKEGEGHIVVCVRIEKAIGSSEAVKLAGKHIIPKLLAAGYITGFESESVPPPTR